MENNENILERTKIVYLIGVGGISMSAIARLLYARGIKILGSDITYNKEIDKLVKDKVIEFKITGSKEYVKNADTIVYTSAISKSNSDLALAKKLNKRIYSRAEILGMLTKYKKTISIAGTHGKTTTTGLVSSILIEAKLNPNIHIGGVLKNINSNVLVSNSELFVTEACEYKDSFLKLSNYISVILNIKPDHLDYFKSFDNLYHSFEKFANQTSENGFVIVNNDDEYARKLQTKSKKLTFAINNQGDIVAKNIKADKTGKFSFILSIGNKRLGKINLSCYGEHNIYNALAAIAVGYVLNLPFKTIKKGIEKFKGIERRFDVIYQSKNKIIMHDYAHHPDEIIATLKLCKNLHYKKLITIFQPHTYSRTNDLYSQFLKCFKSSDEIWLLPIYPAREKRLKGVSSYRMTKDLKKSGAIVKYFKNFDDCQQAITNCKDKSVIFAILGAGNIIDMVERLKKNNI